MRRASEYDTVLAPTRLSMNSVRVEPSGVVVQLRAGEPILAALARNGYTYRFGCRRGGCGVCKVELLAGEVSYPVEIAESVLDEREQASGVCVSCRGVPVTDVVIRLRAGDRLRCVAPLLAALADRGVKSEEGEG